MISRVSLLIVTAALSSLAATGGRAQSEFPNKPIRIILPYATGGKNDILTRLVGEQLSLQWKQRVITEARPGANGRLAYETVARSAPDGHTLVSTVSSIATLPYLYKQLDFDPRRDLVPVTQMFQNQSTVVINPEIPANTIREFVAWVKASPNKVYFGTQGQGNIVHMVFEMLNKAGGISMTPVHYKGTADVNFALQRGDVQASLDGMPPLAKTSQGTPFKVIAVLTDQRVPGYADVPTLMESGLFESAPTSWVGLMAPAGTPKAIVDKIASDIRTVMRTSEDVIQKYKGLSALIVASSPEEFGQKLQAEYKLYADLVKLVGIQPQ